MNSNSNPFAKIHFRGKTEEEISEVITKHFDYVTTVIPCQTSDSAHRTMCNCMIIFNGNDELKYIFVELLMSYAYMDADRKELYLHGIVSQGNVYANAKGKGHQLEPRYSVIEGISDRLCPNALRFIFSIGRIRWKKINSSKPPENRGKLVNMINNLNHQVKCHQEFIDYLREIADKEGECYATRFVRE